MELIVTMLFQHKTRVFVRLEMAVIRHAGYASIDARKEQE